MDAHIVDGAAKDSRRSAERAEEIQALETFPHRTCWGPEISTPPRNPQCVIRGMCRGGQTPDWCAGNLYHFHPQTRQSDMMDIYPTRKVKPVKHVVKLYLRSTETRLTILPKMAKIPEISALSAFLRCPPLGPRRHRRTWMCSAIGRISEIRIFRHLQTHRVELCETDAYRRGLLDRISIK